MEFCMRNPLYKAHTSLALRSFFKLTQIPINVIVCLLMQLNVQITRAFLDNPDSVLSIHTLSRKLGLPYGTAYNRVHLLHKAGILHIRSLGKAKLCALNYPNPLVASILGLGAAQNTSKFFSKKTLDSVFAAKIRDILETRLFDNLFSAIILNYESLAGLPCFAQGEDKSAISSGSNQDNPKNKSADTDEIRPAMNVETSVDLFIVIARDNYSQEQLDTALNTVLPHHSQPRVTHMAVLPSTLIGMFQERENEAGAAAYQMLHRGLVISGFEYFYSLVMKAFPPRIS